MKWYELNSIDADRLRFEARDLLTDTRSEIIPTSSQLHALRCRGFIIGKDGALLRIDSSGKLRECIHGIPCTHYCNGLHDGKCLNYEMPKCGIADGACLYNKEPCNKDCVNNKKSDI